MTHKYGPVLLVEDSMDDFEAVKRAFKKVGLVNPLEHVLSAEDGLEYLRAGNKPTPAFILLDLNMPGMGGRKFLEIIKQDPTFKEIPAIVLPTSNHEPDVKMCYALGANTYILKPIEFDVLVTTMKTLKEYWLETALLT